MLKWIKYRKFNAFVFDYELFCIFFFYNTDDAVILLHYTTTEHNRIVIRSVLDGNFVVRQTVLF